jgi:hypothetical protein
MSIFSDVKDAMATQLAALFAAGGLSVTIKKYRTWDWSESTATKPLLIISVLGYAPEVQLRRAVDISIFTIVRYGNETEASEAETMLDDTDQIIINAYNQESGTHQEAAGVWSAVNFTQPIRREPSRESTIGDRFSESFLRFYIV